MLQVAVDDVLPPDRPIACIKADVEGAELGAFRGALGAIRRSRPVIYFENNAGTQAGPLHDLLAREGYELFWHVNFPYDERNPKRSTANIFGTSVELNILGVHRDSPASAYAYAQLVPNSQPLGIQARQMCATLNAHLRADLRYSRSAQCNAAVAFFEATLNGGISSPLPGQRRRGRRGGRPPRAFAAPALPLITEGDHG